MAAEPRLTITDLRKTYRGGVAANDGISLTAAAGQVLGVLGPNGAGKTTMIRQVLGLAKPTCGSIVIDGVDVVAHPDSARRLCSYQPQNQALVPGVNPRRSIALMGRMRGADRRVAQARTAELIERLRLQEWADRPLGAVSGGTARLVAFCYAVVHPGPVVVLDEPTNDVDPLRRRILWETVHDVAVGGSTILLVTHNVLEAQQAVDRLLIMDRGRIVVSGTPSDLRRQGGDDLRLELRAPPKATIEIPEFATRPEVRGGRLVATVATDHAERAVHWCRDRQRRGEIEEFSLTPVTLEDVYLTSVGGNGAG